METVGEVGQLVLRARNGERAAWSALVGRYWSAVVAVAASEGVREADRDDVAQVTWLRLLQSLDRLENPDAVGAWLRTTATREARRVRARSARTIATESERFDRIPDPQDVEDDVTRRLPDPAFERAFAQLSESCRLLLQLFALDLSYEEIARFMERPLGAIGPTRQRCLSRLRDLLRIPAPDQ